MNGWSYARYFEYIISFTLQNIPERSLHSSHFHTLKSWVKKVKLIHRRQYLIVNQDIIPNLMISECSLFPSCCALYWIFMNQKSDKWCLFFCSHYHGTVSQCKISIKHKFCKDLIFRPLKSNQGIDKMLPSILLILPKYAI